MSIHRSYFSKNNTIQYRSFTNVGRAPYTELYFGSANDVLSSPGYSRFIFDLDLTELIEKFNSGLISTACTNFNGITHKLKMTNTSSFDERYLNTEMSNGRLRATSFDLELHRIPKTSGQTGNPQNWDEGVGNDYYYVKNTSNYSNGLLTPIALPDDKSYSQRPSNWYQSTTLSGWSVNGIYSTTSTTVNYTGLTLVDSQHFQFGNEDIEFDMTNEINSILTGGTTGVTGWVVSFPPQLENMSGLTENYSVAFFSRHTQTFYEPYLETTYNDLISDDRNNFSEKKVNKLYLYSYINGDFQNLDNPPVVSIMNSSNEFISFSGSTELSSCLKTKGVYEVTVPEMSAVTTPSMFYDVWRNISYNNVSLPDEINPLVLKTYKSFFNISYNSREPELFGFDFYGIKQDEKILNTDVRKVGVIVKKAYTTQEILSDISAFYRVYVREGTTEVQVQDWTPINKTPNEYYFIFDTKDKIPNEYYIDIKVYSSGQVDTYKNTLSFQIVNKK